MNYYIAVIKKYAVFGGRAQRAEYWYFMLFTFLVSVTLGTYSFMFKNGTNTIGALYNLVILLPAIGVSIRRLHDTGKSGWWIFTVLIPFWLIVLMAIDSDFGDNKYGPNPKGINI